MKPWVLVYVTAKNCPACIKFNDKWPEIKKAFLSSVGAEVDIIDLTFDNMNKPVIDSTKYPLDLKCCFEKYSRTYLWICLQRKFYSNRTRTFPCCETKRTTNSNQW